MGVTGMKDLVKESKTSDNFWFQNSQVIIDGPNLYYSLYFNSNPKMDQQHGGDYPAFTEQVRMFFTNLRRCNITALVVLDGGSEPGKEETVGARLKDKLQKAKRISESSANQWDNILPPLVKDLFIQILQELQIEMEQCFGEADLTAVLRANERRCPILSNDSDFYIFDVQEGFLSIDSFQWQCETNVAIPALRYRTSQFCDHFKVDRNHLPVFAAISGNDYSRLEDRGAFSRRYPEPQQPGGYSAHRRRAILRFLAGFKGKTSEEAVRAALQLAGETQEEVIEHFLESTRKYALENPPRPNLPEWIIHEVHRGRLTSFVTSVLTQKSMTLTPLVEDFSKPSSYDASLRIRQFFYGLLVGTQPCKEYDRKEADAVCAKEVTPVLPSVTPEDLQRLELNNLNEAPEDLRCNVLYEALRCSRLDAESIPNHLKLPLCVTRFWFQYRQQNYPDHQTNMSCLQALVLGFVYGEADADPEFKTRMDHLEPGGKRLQLDVAHAFSQWQNCMRQSLHLNQLLSFPLPEPQCSRLYCGPLLHKLQNALLSHSRTFTELKVLLAERWRVLLETLLQSAGVGPSGDDEGWQTQTRKKRRN